MNWNKLSLRKMVFYGHHGVYPGEKQFGQRIEVDADLWADFSQAARTDDLRATVNYAAVYEDIKEIVERRSFNLIEALALAIAERIKDGYGIDKVTVRVRKPQPPAGGLMDTVEFEISLEK